MGSLWQNGPATNGKIGCQVTQGAAATSIVIDAMDCGGQVIHEKTLYSD
jgi:hypothetical protein